MIRICVLSSGSKGNAIYLESPRARILVDAGLSAREMVRRLKLVGRSPRDLHAILVTHEHHDHIRGVGVLSRRCGLPVYISGPTLQRASQFIEPLAKVFEFEAGSPFAINDFHVHPFRVTHDAVDPVNFVISGPAAKVGIATDLGYASHLVKESLKGCRILILETNHDLHMLENGPYPWSLKQRIKSKRGHLSNGQGAVLLKEVLHHGLKHVCLAHLSETNNLPRKAVARVRRVLGPRLDGIKLHVAGQHRVGPFLEAD